MIKEWMKYMNTLKKIKPRNHVILAMLKMGRKTIVHQKSNKAKRRIEKVKLKDEY